MSRFKQSENEIVRNAVLNDGLNEVYVGSQTAKNILIKTGYFLAGIMICLLIWHFFGTFFNENIAKHIFFPLPLECFERMIEFFTEDFSVLGTDIVVHMKYSLIRWIKGFYIAAVIGVILGILMSLDDRIYKLGIVPVNILQMIPGLAWYPVCILLFGLGETSAIFIIAITVISPIAINICNGLRRVPKVNIRVADMCGKSYAEKFVEILLPFAALDFITGFRIGMANAWRMLIAAEMVVGVAVGLGYAIQIETAYLDYVSAFACIVIICIIGILIDKVFFGTIESYASKKLGVGESS